MANLFKSRNKDIARCKSLVIMISQTRDNIGFGAMFQPKTRSCGKALKFFVSHELWLSTGTKIKIGKRTLATNVIGKLTKNKLTGRHGEAHFQVLNDYGVDNITSCIQFLIEEKKWSSGRGTVDTKGFLSLDKSIPTQDLISLIERTNSEVELYSLCKTTYDGIIEKLTPSNRKFRY